MKNILMIGFHVLVTMTYSQNNDELFFSRCNHDTIIFFLDEVGDVTVKSKAYLYRKASIDNENYTFLGKVEDYYLNNQKAYECYYSNNKLNGDVKCYYENGQIKYQGYFNESLKDSLWTFYYDNGKILVHDKKL